MVESEFMRPTEVARLFHVNIRTVARWAHGGLLRSDITLGGHRRYYREEVMRLYGERNGGKAA